MIKLFVPDVETGAVVTYTGKGNPCANHLLPEHHLVLVDVNDLVLNLEQAWEKINGDLGKDGRPRGINMIAGPSSTAVHCHSLADGF